MQTVTTLGIDHIDSHAPFTVPEMIEEQIRQALSGLQYGEINITVRNGSVTQIERVARRRQFKSRRDA